MEATIEFSMKGFRVTLTIDGERLELWDKLNSSIDWLIARGATPAIQEAALQNELGAPRADHICPIHHVQMTRREKNGKVWYSHKAMDPETGEEYWCNEGKGK